MRRKVSRVSALLVSAVVPTVLAPLFMGLAGCQVDLSGSVGAKAFYPDKLAGEKNDVGDPRKGAYDGSGYGERNTTGSESGMLMGGGFQGMSGEASTKGGK